MELLKFSLQILQYQNELFEKANIFHSDLKPDNIIILKFEDKDDCFEYKLIDFDAALYITNKEDKKEFLEYGLRGKTH